MLSREECHSRMDQNNIEMIGKIKLDLSHYLGEDIYSDGDIEDELLRIARDRSEVEFQQIIEERKSWPILYHLSALRENIVEWLPITSDMKVLEVGAGCGAITGALSRKAGSVTCIDLSKKRSMINAYRHMDRDNVTIKVGNFMDIEPDLETDFDYVCLIGVFEYGQAYTGGETPYEDLLNILKRHCKPQGHIVIAIENKFGLKYWAGCKEDHLGTYFSGLEGYPDGGVVRTFTRRGLEEIADRCGCKERQMFYPYPDYKFMVDLYSDERLPKKGELKNNLRNFDRDRIRLFDEKLVFDSILEEKEFPLFSNSYLMVLGPKLDINYVRYSNDRSPSYQIKTVEKSGDAGKIIEKHALSKDSCEHIRRMHEMGLRLAARYQGSTVEINRSALTDTETECYVSLEYVQGETLEKLLDDCMLQGDVEGFNRLFDEYLERIDYHKDVAVTDFDLAFSNILVDGDMWTSVDYEWTYEKSIPVKEIAFRAVYCYILEDKKREKFNLDYIYHKLGISEEDAKELREREMSFQKMVTGKRMALGEIREAIGNEVYTVNALEIPHKGPDLAARVQVYEDFGTGFSEELSTFFEETEFFMKISGKRKTLRIDPCSDYCIVHVKDIKWNGVSVFGTARISSNGQELADRIYGFPTRDPNIVCNVEQMEQDFENELIVSMEVTRLSEATAMQFQTKKSLKQRLLGK